MNYWNLPPREGRPHSCHSHLTPDERAEYQLDVQEAERQRRAAWKQFLATPPACWNWPVPEDIASWEPSLNVDEGALSEKALAMLRRANEDPETRQESLLSEWQRGRCAICGDNSYLETDHDHESGLVRGLLCHSCNTREGFHPRVPTGPFGWYRSRPPTAILGFEIRYWDPIAKDYAPDLRGRPAPDLWADAASEDIGL
ncbi:endonuclease domain-containing protein [Streptomyces sp. XC 2026]|uniref:endonuclease domain-containing protein n=1 Tax=Streptomyces sp. XC 2026 TaxID=2782004 RepID=UPI001F44E642|nr:endonuclease domain-containing protein [Streptomyces sp. XC 2026]